MPSSIIVQKTASHNRILEVCHSKMKNRPYLRTRQEIMTPIIPLLIYHVQKNMEPTLLNDNFSDKQSGIGKKV